MAKKDVENSKKLPYVWASIRLMLGFTFLWAFADKMIGLGFQTCLDKTKDAIFLNCESAFVNGGSPTEYWLTHSTKGPLHDFYYGLAGNPGVDLLFMVGLLAIGVSLTLGVFMRLGVASAILLMLMMWSASLPPANNPIIDDHLIYIAALIGIYLTNKDQVWGLGKYWQSKSMVKKYKWLA